MINKIHYYFRFILFIAVSQWLCLLHPSSSLSAEIEEDLLAKSVTVDLRSPTYSEGVLITECGGVITGPDFRIQATKITYTKKNKKGESVYTIEAEDDLMMEFGEYFFIGKRLEYDFKTKIGVIYEGRTMAEPWYFGGEKIVLCADGSYILYNGFVTTSTNYCNEWEVTSEEASLCEGRYLSARNVQFRLFKVPILWLPKLQINLDDIYDAPVKYSVRLWGRQGPRVGITYQLFSWNRCKTFVRLDYRFNRGLGAGIETRYQSVDHKTNLHTINYVAMDSSLIHPNERIRYRFQGVFDTKLMNDTVSVDLSWDKLSDKSMATDYKDKGLELDTAGRTQLLIRRQEERWITNLFSRVRVNSFQSLKQELPTLENTWHPFELGQTGIISDTLFKASYLDFVYGSNLKHVHNFASSRFELSPKVYRHLNFGNLNITPEIGGVTIIYGNSPHNADAKWLAIGKAGCEVNTHLTRVFRNYKHVITPYASYNYYTYPTVSPNDHYIFDIEDGWYRLNMMRFGLSQSVFGRASNGLVERKIFADIYGNAFFDTRTIHAVVPKVYADVVFKVHPCLKHTLETAWDFSRNQLDHYNIRTEWTINDDLALSAEYRHRDAYDWRKADHTNFILDSYRSISQLRHSLLSDRRDTFLLHLFCRLHPNWAIEFESRQGWNRMFEPKYTEFEIDLLATLRSSINLKLAYQHRENDDRIAVYFNIGLKRPDAEKACNVIPYLDF
ncbi:MAG: LPS assembly protein LptD [Parachlamydiaceae bacterium]|nr:LPS assembly protein LptD [Parachlamydiaceae bacterium]